MKVPTTSLTLWFDAMEERTDRHTLLVRNASGSSTLHHLRMVVVALDGSDLAERVLPYVVDLAGPTGATIVLVRAVPSMDEVLIHSLGSEALAPAVPIDIPGSVEAGRHQAEEYLADIREELSKGTRLHVRTRVLEGDAARRILDLAQETGADLIALSTHGRTGVRRVLFGSVAEAVIRRAACPVLVLPARPHPAARAASPGRSE